MAALPDDTKDADTREEDGGVARVVPATKPVTSQYTPIARGRTFPGLGRILSLYAQASDPDRFAMLEMIESFAANSAFHASASSFIRHNPHHPFRFMDLPTEIRAIIAGYAFKSDQMLVFRWLERRSTGWVGVFEGTEELTALARTCKQAHSELSHMVWKINTFRISGDILIPPPRSTFHYPQLQESLLEAIKFLVDSSNGRTFKSLSLVVPIEMVAGFGSSCGLAESSLTYCFHIQNLMPEARIEFYARWWECDDYEEGFVVRVRMTLQVGYSMIKALANEDSKGIPRAWTLHPYISSRDWIVMKQNLIAAGREQIIKWAEEGL
ncbi:hypothetical protein C7974DRAFT_407271 [Boeremia exigua]|uniref:uncharacterized protein n=1 Tax=Boeremia exigua TaxID=749465 RepID=UPI001E8E6A4F|nr:uncharacterized protein C7974DRAFT_407271 [Boeremia exigua]KAH6643533.1 hypothetical protein C7974DRAFT_407271 [Boeremia exigua]